MNDASNLPDDRSTDAGDRLASARQSPVRKAAVWWWVLGVGIALTAVIVAIRIWGGDAIAPLRPEDFHAARARWEASSPANYDIEVVVRGSQPATYSVEVRDGRPQSAQRNGRPLTQRRTFGTWSVPGMFSTMSRDVEAVERLEQGQADPAAPRLSLRADFDTRYGYPARYRRIQWGSPVEVSWEVTKFELK